MEDGIRLHGGVVLWAYSQKQSMLLSKISFQNVSSISNPFSWWYKMLCCTPEQGGGLFRKRETCYTLDAVHVCSMCS